MIFIFLNCKNTVQKNKNHNLNNYNFDTIYKNFKGDFTKKYKGGIDIHQKDTNLFLIYNFFGSNCVKLLDLNNVKSIDYEFINPNGNYIYTNMINKDLYILSSNGNLYKNCDNNFEKLYNVYEIEKLKNSGLEIENYKPGSDSYIDIDDTIMYFRLIKKFDENENGKYTKKGIYPYIARLEINSKKISFFGEKSDKIDEQEYGLISSIYDLYKKDFVISSNAINGVITVINSDNNEKKIFNLKSKYDNKEIEKFDFSNRKDVLNRKMDHLLEQPHYEPLFYNNINKKYYRVFHPKMDLFDEKGLKKIESDKASILMIFNEKLEIIDEIILPVNSLQILKILPLRNGVEIFLPELFKIDQNSKTYAFLKITQK